MKKERENKRDKRKRGSNQRSPLCKLRTGGGAADANLWVASAAFATLPSSERLPPSWISLTFFNVHKCLWCIKRAGETLQTYGPREHYVFSLPINTQSQRWVQRCVFWCRAFFTITFFTHAKEESSYACFSHLASLQSPVVCCFSMIQKPVLIKHLSWLADLWCLTALIE